jgi:hypothetical protein
MDTITRIKLALGIIGLIIFGYGVRADDVTIRYIGVGFVAAAWLLRFTRKKGPPPEVPPPPGA